MSDIATELTRIKNAKTSIISAMESVGIDVPDGTLLDGLSSLFDQLAGESTVQITLTLTKRNGLYYEAKFTGTATTESDIFDCIELVVPEDRDESIKAIKLVTGCLGEYSGKAKKVVIPEEITTLEEQCINDDTVTEIDVCGSPSYADGAFYNCKNLRTVLFNGVEVSMEDLTMDPNA